MTQLYRGLFLQEKALGHKAGCSFSSISEVRKEWSFVAFMLCRSILYRFAISSKRFILSAETL